MKNNVRDSCCMLHSGDAIEVHGFIQHDGESFVLAKKFTNPECFFEAPVNSASTLGIILVSQPSQELFAFKTEEVNYKLMRLPYKDQFVLIPMLHCPI